MIIIVTVRLDVVPMKNDEKTRRRKKADLCVFLSVFFFFVITARAIAVVLLMAFLHVCLCVCVNGDELVFFFSMKKKHKLMQCVTLH